MSELVPQPSIDDLRGGTLAALVARLGAIDLTPLLVYRIASVPDSALIALAWQFDVLDPGWMLSAQGVAEGIDTLSDIDTLTDIDTMESASSSDGPSDWDTRRALLLASIPLHRTRGTPASIIDALAAIGFPGATLLEGQNSWGGVSWPSGEGWAVFRVVINLSGRAVAAADIARITAAANFFKPVRCWLDSVAFIAQPIVDTAPTPADFVTGIFSHGDAAPTPADEVSAPAWPLADTRAVAPYHDDHYYHGGATTYGAPQPAAADWVTVNGVAISARG